MTYPEWVQLLLRMHRHERGHRQRCTGCWACDVLDLPETDRMRCADLSRGAPGTVGGFDGHHVIPKQVLKRSLGERMFKVVVFDERVGVPLRRWHHDQWEARRLQVPRSMLPPALETFAVEHGLDWWLWRTFGKAER